MAELVPFVLVLVLGAFIWRNTTGGMRLALSIGAVVVSGATATLISGEYVASWIYLLFDVSEAAIGLAIGVTIAHRVLRPWGIGIACRTHRSHNAGALSV